jgi:ABC-type lipoprotein export system ATPase subunit|tara:strand:- start:322 stop:975 length:654 start_codon:yes stop_codon:yes gene_type:complete
MFLETNKLSKQYGSKTVLDEVRLKIHKGDFVSIVGPSGSGKTTLLNILSLISNQTSGDYWFLGRDNRTILSNYNDLTNCRKEIGVMSNLSELLPGLTIRDNILLPAYINNNSNSIEKNLQELVRFTDIVDLQNEKPISLSSGERQRALLCRALIMNPKILIADEPTSNLDERNALNLIEYLVNLNDKNKTTIIMATHDHKVYTKTKTIYELNDGKLN